MLPVHRARRPDRFLESPDMAVRTPSQLAWRRRVEAGIRLAAPALDLVLFVGDRVSRVVGRGEPEPEPPRRMGRAPDQAPLDRAAGPT
jgi:hypothetical protein